MRPIPADECVRACEWLSLRLDAQLSDFELLLLDTHLAQCGECRAFAGGVTAFTEALRAAPLEESSLEFEFPRRRAVRMLGLRAVSAAAIAAVFGLSGLVSLELSDRKAPSAAVRFDPAVIGLKERQLQELDNAGRRGARAIAPGLAAAEKVTFGKVVAPGPRSSGRRATGTISPQTVTPNS